MNTSTPTPDRFDTPITPRVLSVRHLGTLADRSEFLAMVDYGEGYTDNGKPLKVSFVGSSTPGHPGRVLIKCEGWRDFESVDNPSRFGDTFGAAWIRAFYA